MFLMRKYLLQLSNIVTTENFVLFTFTFFSKPQVGSIPVTMSETGDTSLTEDFVSIS